MGNATTGATRTRRTPRLLAAALALGSLASPSVGRAQEPVADGPGEATVNPTLRAMSEGLLSPLTMPARVGSTAAFAWGLGGYDTSRKGALVDAIAEVRVWGPIALRGGVTYSNGTERMRPNVGARVQLLRQEKHAVDGSLSVFYKPEGFTEPEGEIETTVALSQAFEALTVAGNLVYGQDPEGNERDGEIRATVFRRRGRLSYGLEARTRFAIGTQQGKAATTEPRLDAMGGPIVACALGPVAVFAEVGPSVFRLGDSTRAGAAGFGGLATAF